MPDPITSGRTPSSPCAYHTLDSRILAARLGSDPERGLSAVTVIERQARYGPNAIREGARAACCACCWRSSPTS